MSVDAASCVEIIFMDVAFLVRTRAIRLKPVSPNVRVQVARAVARKAAPDSLVKKRVSPRSPATICSAP